MKLVKQIDNLKVKSIVQLNSPAVMINKLKPTTDVAEGICRHRGAIANIISGVDRRLLVVVGPCSIHDVSSALEYAERLALLQKKYKDQLLLVMRVYLEKPRTIIGWKGLVNDPNLDGSCDINLGLELSRKLMLDISQLGVPIATEFLDNLLPQYLSDLVSWAAIGARTTESQLHRQVASGLSMPVGFKNPTNGDTDIAMEAIISAGYAHNFMGINQKGYVSMVKTTGNKDCHIVLRGSKQGPNYSKLDIDNVINKLEDLAQKHDFLSPRLMVDASHGNSFKQYLLQKEVVEDICAQIILASKNLSVNRVNNSNPILGVMLESNLYEGAQKLDIRPSIEQEQEQGQEQGLVTGQAINSALKDLDYGVSVTDSCLSWEQTVPLLDKLANAVNIFNYNLVSMKSKLYSEILL